MSENIDERAVGRHEGLLMACSWLEAMEREAWKRRDKWLRSQEYDHAATSAAVAAELRLAAADIGRKAAAQMDCVCGGNPGDYDDPHTARAAADYTADTLDGVGVPGEPPPYPPSLPAAPEERVDACLNCGSTNVEEARGRYASGVTGPNGEQEWLEQSGWGCKDCGAVEDKLGSVPAAPPAGGEGDVMLQRDLEWVLRLEQRDWKCEPNKLLADIQNIAKRALASLGRSATSQTKESPR